MENIKKAVFAGGCFWCMEPPFHKLNGVKGVLPGYTGGYVKNPTYEQVCNGNTGHYEAVEVTYDPEKITFKELLQVFWRQIDPTDEGGQFADRGQQYQAVIFYTDEEERLTALKSKEELEKSGKFNETVKTKILPASEFYPAEENHCRFFEKKPDHYKRYKAGSGRQDFIDHLWGKHDG